MLAVFSDVHSNAAALSAVLEDARRREADRFVALGDVVGYNCFPGETIDLLRGAGAAGVIGNHDLMALGRLEPDRCGPNARRAILWTRGALRGSERDYLDALPPSRLIGDEILMLHSALGDPVVYLRSREQFLAQYRAIRKAHPAVRICLTGHTHVGRIVEIRNASEVRLRGRRRLRLRPDRFYFVNPGSVGHPRQEDYRASYLLFEPATDRVRFRKVRYDRAGVDAANRALGIETHLGAPVLSFRWHAARASLRRLARRIGMTDR
jgi:predicted phosphodiesterase